MNPKFKIGETIIIACKILPEFDGTEHVITDIAEVTFPNHNNRKLLCYTLDFTYEWQGVKDYKYWVEGCLRKKQQPSEFSFTQLMDNLKLPQKVN
ncbi:hypothetical protein D3C71_1968160 [compost metagenome]